MAVLKGNLKPRRRDVRKTIPRTRQTYREISGRPEFPLVVGFGMLFVVLASIIVLQARSEPTLVPGQVVDETIMPRVEMRVRNLADYQFKQDTARAQTPRVYRPNSVWFSSGSNPVRNPILNLPSAVANAQSASNVHRDIRDPFALNDRTINALQMYVENGNTTEAWRSAMDRMFSRLQQVYILTDEQFQNESQTQRDIIVELGPNQQPIRARPDLIHPIGGEALDKVLREQVLHDLPEAIQISLAHYIAKSGHATYLLDTDATLAAEEAAAEAVEPSTTTYRTKDPLILAGTVLDREGRDLIVYERTQWINSLSATDQIMLQLGPIFIVLLIATGLVTCMVAYHPRILQNILRLTTLGGLLIATLTLAWLTRPIGPHFGMAGLIGPLLLTGVILAIAYDRHFAIAVTILQAGLFGLAFHLSMPTVLLLIAASVVAILQMRELRNRSSLIRIGFVAALVVLVGVWAVGVTERNLLVDGVYRELLLNSIWAFIATMAVGFFVLGMLPFIENIFNVTTSMTLLELCDVNQPLLRQLAQTSPGTYNHSLTIGIIAESACEAIGASGLLCRVGAYYHDIGKMNKPQYFIENQAGGPNKHEKLSPAMSLLIIVGHVKDGIEMAREYGLPRSLHHFIESHHGTTLVEYFYNAAKNSASEGQAPAEVEFRYPGPKPQTREAAILMLCDSVESASRTLSDPNAARIEQLVHAIAMKRLMDGQFDDCGLTLSELHLVEQSIIKSLCGIYHGRIKYPAGEKKNAPSKVG